MQLKPLEFSDCLTDSPFFRQNLHQHEIALEQTSKKIKEVEQQCRKILTYTNKLSQAQKQLAETLNDFKLGMIGSMSEDDVALANYVKQLASVINMIEEQRTKTVHETEKLYLSPLQSLVEKINRVRDERQKYSKESSKFYQALERNLNLKVTTVRKCDFREADAQLAMQQRNFCKASLNYVSEIQTIQECVRIEFVQTTSSFLYQWLIFYHMANAIQMDFRTTYSEINGKIQKAKENFEVQQIEADELRRKMLVGFMRNTVFQSEAAAASADPDEEGMAANYCGSGAVKQGYLFMHEKSLLPRAIGRDARSNWTKYYCVYSKETKIFTLIPISSNVVKTDLKGAGWIDHTVSFKKLHCTKRAPDTIDKRFCFDIVPENRPELFTFQALSERDCSQWLETMDGREPVSGNASGTSSSSLTMLDEAGFEFIRNCIDVIEEKGIKEQGIYRNCGVNSKVQKLMQIALDRRKAEKLNVADPEWEIKTISSAVKTFLRNLPEPLMTFELHQNFIQAAKTHDATQRVQQIHYWVYKLPAPRKSMLEMIIRHLRKVADESSENLMSVGNLAVCFGPTLLRPREETVAAVLDIKFCNVVVEALIANCQLIFVTQPQKFEYPPKPAKNMVLATAATTDESVCSSRSSEGLASSLGEIIIDNYQSTDSLGPDPTTAEFPTAPGLETTPRGISRSAQNFPAAVDATTARNSGSGNQRQRTHGGAGSSASDIIGKQFESRSELCLISTESPEKMQHTKNAAAEFDSLASTSSSQSVSVDHSSQATARGKTRGQYAPSYPSMDAHNQSAYIYSTLRTPISTGSNNSSQIYMADQPSSTAAAVNFARYSSNTLPHDASMASSIAMRIPPAYSNFINPNMPLHPPRRVRTLYPCVAGHETELSFESGQIITNVYESKEDGWLVGTLNGKTGLIPANYVSYVDNF